MNFNKEYVDFNQKCVKCNIVEKHTKEIKFVDFPTILILSIQRLDFVNKSKNDCKITFQDKLDINNFIDKDFYSNNRSVYDLYGFINHVGTLDFGHYYSLIKFEDNLYEFNGSSVIKRDNFYDCFESVYSLVYAKN